MNRHYPSENTFCLDHQSGTKLHFGKRGYMGIFILAFIIGFGITGLCAGSAYGFNKPVDSGDKKTDAPKFMGSVQQTAGLIEADGPDQSGLPFVSSIYGEELDMFGDYSIGSSVRRLPGVQGMRDGSFSIRGTGLHQYNITVDGQQMATSGMGSRVMNPGGLAVDLIRDLEIIRVVTPDMSAETLGGVVNLKTHSPISEDRQIRLRAGGGYDTRYSDYLRPLTRSSLFYSDSPVENLHITANLHYQRENHALEYLETRYDVTDFGDGPVDVLEHVAPGLQTDQRDRFGGALSLRYQQSEQSLYHLRAVIGNDYRKVNRHQVMYSANEAWVDTRSTRPMAELLMDSQLQSTDIKRYMVETGGRHQLEVFNLEYRFGWARTRIEKYDYRFPFLTNRLEYQTDMDNRKRPDMSLVNGAVEKSDMALQDMDYVINDHLDNHFTGNIDLEIPHRLGSVRVGSSALLRIKDAKEDGAYAKYFYSFPRLNIGHFDHNTPSTADLFDDHYQLSWILDNDAAKDFFHSSIPNMSYDREKFHRETDIWNYRANEQIYAGYGMATLEMGLLTLMGGLRVEHTEAEYDSRKVMFNRFGLYDDTMDTTASNSYTHLFPNARITFEPVSQAGIHLAYSRTLRRPDFNHAAPFELITARDTTIFRGNPELKPVVSHNYDFYAEYESPFLGSVHAGLFYKELDQFVTLQRRTLELSRGDVSYLDGELFAGEEEVITANERVYENRDQSATIYGAEFSWRHDLRYLPGFLQNMHLFANYSWSQSDYEPQSRDEALSLPFQSPHIVNLAIGYDLGRFSSQLSYYHAAEVLQQYSEEPRMAPSLSDERMHMDYYADGWSDLSATIRFRISTHFTVWADATNLLDNEQVVYREQRDLYPQRIEYQQGQTLLMGLHYAF